MTEFLHVAGSFAIVWLGLWFALAAVLALVYPLLRASLMSWHPAVANNLLLLLLAFPFLLSLSCTLFLFLPAFETVLVARHCHDSCGTHLPLIDNPELAILGLSLVLTIACLLGYRLWINLRVSGQLKRQLAHLSENKGDYRVLDNDSPFVFTLGWWRNKVYVTSGLQRRCDDQDMQVILAHEQAHSRRRDNVRLLTAMLFTLVLPARLARLLNEDLHLLIESACDFAAAEDFGDLNVAETLLKIQRLSPAQWELGKTVIVSAFTGSEIEQRVKALVHGRQLSVMQQAGFQLSLFVLLLASLMLVEPLHHGVEVLFALH